MHGIFHQLNLTSILNNFLSSTFLDICCNYMDKCMYILYNQAIKDQYEHLGFLQIYPLLCIYIQNRLSRNLLMIYMILSSLQNCIHIIRVSHEATAYCQIEYFR